MEVPGSNDIICDFCFAMNPQGAHICEECGAPLVDGKEAGDESDQLVYRDLARANLQRMRGDFAAARETCLSILRRYPNNATTQGLLGDICREQGELGQAKEWYAMALDVRPDDENVRTRLRETETAMAAQEEALRVKVAEVPRTGGRWFVAGLAVIAVGMAGGAYWLGKNTKPTTAAQRPAPIPLGQAQPSTSAATEGPSTTVEPALTATPELEAERQARAFLAGACQLSETRFLDVELDPRGNVWRVTLSALPTDDPTTLVLQVLNPGLDGDDAPSTMSVRLIRDGRLLYAADGTRQVRVARGTSLMAAADLQNVWPAGTGASPSQPPPTNPVNPAPTEPTDPTTPAPNPSESGSETAGN